MLEEFFYIKQTFNLMYLQPAREEKRYSREIKFPMKQISTHMITIGQDAAFPEKESKPWTGARQKKTSALTKASAKVETHWFPLLSYANICVLREEREMETRREEERRRGIGRV